MDKTNTLAAISMKTMGYTPKQLRSLVENQKGAVFIGRIKGFSTSFFTGLSKHGEWVGFKGDFVAVNKDGEIFDGGTLFAPAEISRPLTERHKSGADQVLVEADIYAQENEDSAVGYIYVCKPILTDENKGKMERMKSTLLKDLPNVETKQIEAPKADKKKTA